LHRVSYFHSGNEQLCWCFKRRRGDSAIVGDPAVGRIPSKWFEARGLIYNSWLETYFGLKMELWAWGANNYGQLATGNFEDFFKPTKIMCKVHSDTIVVPGGGIF